MRRLIFPHSLLPEGCRRRVYLTCQNRLRAPVNTDLFYSRQLREGISWLYHSPKYSKLGRLGIYLRCPVCFSREVYGSLLAAVDKIPHLTYSERQRRLVFLSQLKISLEIIAAKRFKSRIAEVRKGMWSFRMGLILPWRKWKNCRSQKGIYSRRMRLILPVSKQKNCREKYLILLGNMKLQLKLNSTSTKCRDLSRWGAGNNSKIHSPSTECS